MKSKLTARGAGWRGGMVCRRRMRRFFFLFSPCTKKPILSGPYKLINLAANNCQAALRARGNGTERVREYSRGRESWTEWERERSQISGVDLAVSRGHVFSTLRSTPMRMPDRKNSQPLPGHKSFLQVYARRASTAPSASRQIDPPRN